jgi:predicted metal-dependent hydrolase
MAGKIFDIAGIGSVTVLKRRGSKSIKLSFDSKGEVRVSIPSWVPYQTGAVFARERTDWIIEHQPTPTRLFSSGDRIGKAHHMTLIPDAVVKTTQVRLKGSEIIVKYPGRFNFDDPLVQTAAERGAKKALWGEGERLLPQRLKLLADEHGFSYHSITVKQLKTKWGSCNQNHEITLNYYLMQLPWHLIDYVLVHELVHTEHLNHSDEFWERFEEAMPGAKKIRKELKTYKTSVIPN